MEFSSPWHLFIMVVLYIFAGLMHFIKPKMYLRVMPNYIPMPKAMVFWSGMAEVLFGIGLCFKTTKNIAIYGIILMLFVFLLVHFYMLSGKKQAAGIPKWILLLRLPVQFALMYWAFSYLK